MKREVGGATALRHGSDGSFFDAVMTIRSTESAHKPHKSVPIMAAKVPLNDESTDDKKTIGKSTEHDSH